MELLFFYFKGIHDVAANAQASGAAQAGNLLGKLNLGGAGN